MRLLDTTTLVLHEFWDNSIPCYAALSHTWERDEVTFQEIQNLTPKIREKQGYQKIKKCCEIATADGFKWVWVDTCCIDKTSSSELSEAINSMYKWYQSSLVCYAYLADFDGGSRHTPLSSDFASSRWFTRGWTLQELIAPQHVVFFDKSWKDIGTKFSRRYQLHQITGIDIDALVGSPLHKYSLAQRMSWAANRQTTRTEDIAYCLLGIFGINMPMMYGEGERAFTRLQETIMRQTSDFSLLAWDRTQEAFAQHRGRLLATSPSFFSKTELIICEHRLGRQPPDRFIVTDDGVLFELPVLTTTSSEKDLTSLILLNCHFEYMLDEMLALELDHNTGRTKLKGLTSVFSAFPANWQPYPFKMKPFFIEHASIHESSLSSPTLPVIVNIHNLKELNHFLISRTSKEELGHSVLIQLDGMPYQHSSAITKIYFWDPQGEGCLLALDSHSSKESKTMLGAGFRSVARSSFFKGNVRDHLYNLNMFEGTYGFDDILWRHPESSWSLDIQIRQKIQQEQPVMVISVTVTGSEL